MTKTRKKKLNEEEQDLAAKLGKASMIQGVYKIVEHQLNNNQSNTIDMTAIANFYTEKQDVAVSDPVFTDNCHFARETQLVLSNCSKGDIGTDENTYSANMMVLKK